MPGHLVSHSFNLLFLLSISTSSISFGSASIPNQIAFTVLTCHLMMEDNIWGEYVTLASVGKLLKRARP